VARFEIVLAACVVSLAAAGAVAQPRAGSPAETPVMVDGWRHVNAPDDLHVYVCVSISCVERSIVMFRFMEPGPPAVAPGQFHRWEKAAREALLMAPQIEGTFAGGPMDLATWRSHGSAMTANGAIEHYTHGFAKSAKWQTYVISISSNQSASDGNAALFEEALKANR
jgi:hypothetical protein